MKKLDLLFLSILLSHCVLSAQAQELSSDQSGISSYFKTREKMYLKNDDFVKYYIDNVGHLPESTIRKLAPNAGSIAFAKSLILNNILGANHEISNAFVSKDFSSVKFFDKSEQMPKYIIIDNDVK